MLTGLPGTGKSAIAQALAARVPGAVVLNKDEIRPALFPEERIEYSERQDDFVLGIMLQTAEYVFERDPSAWVILDGRTFSKQYQRDLVAEAVRRMKQPLRVVEVTALPEIAKSRLAADTLSGAHPARNRDEALYERVRAHFEPVSEPKIVIDASTDSAGRLAEELRRRLDC